MNIRNSKIRNCWCCYKCWSSKNTPHFDISCSFEMNYTHWPACGLDCYRNIRWISHDYYFGCSHLHCSLLSLSHSQIQTYCFCFWIVRPYSTCISYCISHFAIGLVATETYFHFCISWEGASYYWSLLLRITKVSLTYWYYNTFGHHFYGKNYWPCFYVFPVIWILCTKAIFLYSIYAHF